MANDVTETEPTIEDRLATAEKEIATLKNESTQHGWNMVVLAVCGIACLGVLGWALKPGSEPKPTNHDVSVDELLHAGVHCYDSSPERAAARQRALAAIDRIDWVKKWESDHPPAGGYPLGAPGPPPSAEPTVRDTPMPGATWDATRCFEIIIQAV